MLTVIQADRKPVEVSYPASVRVIPRADASQHIKSGYTSNTWDTPSPMTRCTASPLYGAQISGGGVSSSLLPENHHRRQIIPNPGPRGSAPPPPASSSAASLAHARPVPDDSARLAGQELPPDEDTLAIKAGKLDLRDREYENIDITSPIRLSRQAKDIIAKLRKMRDEQEDWIK
jgi:hypothetical protein